MDGWAVTVLVAAGTVLEAVSVVVDVAVTIEKTVNVPVVVVAVNEVRTVLKVDTKVAVVVQVVVIAAVVLVLNDEALVLDDVKEVEVDCCAGPERAYVYPSSEEKYRFPSESIAAAASAMPSPVAYFQNR